MNLDSGIEQAISRLKEIAEDNTHHIDKSDMLMYLGQAVHFLRNLNQQYNHYFGKSVSNPKVYISYGDSDSPVALTFMWGDHDRSPSLEVEITYPGNVDDTHLSIQGNTGCNNAFGEGYVLQSVGEVTDDYDYLIFWMRSYL